MGISYQRPPQWQNITDCCQNNDISRKMPDISTNDNTPTAWLPITQIERRWRISLRAHQGISASMRDQNSFLEIVPIIGLVTGCMRLWYFPGNTDGEMGQKLGNLHISRLWASGAAKDLEQPEEVFRTIKALFPNLREIAGYDKSEAWKKLAELALMETTWSSQSTSRSSWL